MFLSTKLDILSSPRILLFAKLLDIDYISLDQSMCVEKSMDFLFYI